MNPTLPPLTDVLNLLPDAVCVVAEDSRYLFVSAGFERILGYRAAEVPAGLRLRPSPRS